MRIVAGLLIVFAVAGGAQADMWDTPPVDYTCSDGVPRSVVYRADGNYAWMSIDSSPPVELPRTGASTWQTAHFAVRVVPYGMDVRVFRGGWVRCEGPAAASTVVSVRG
jgi:hypothetical protein